MAEADRPWVALLATEALPIAVEPVRRALAGRAEARIVAMPYKPLSPQEEAHYAGLLRGAGAILLRSGYVTASLLDRLPELRVVAVHGAGVDPVDVAACTARGVLVTNTPGANADAVAELTVALMLTLYRQIPAAAEKVRAQRLWDGARQTGRELRGKCLGLIGLGRIGQKVAGVAAAFGMTILAHDPALTDRAIRAHGAEPADLDGLLARADIVSLHAPAIPATHHLIDAARLARMKADAVLINCARGSLVDEGALAEALAAGRLGGAALDVLDGEPPDPASPIFAAPNLVLTPHMAGSTHECLQTIARTAGEDIARVLAGRPARHPVNDPRR